MRFAIDPVNVSHERMQDEVIIINLGRGAYYSGSGTAADMWTLVAAGVSAEQTASTLATLYSAGLPAVTEGVNACLQSLIERGVISETSGDQPADVPALPEMTRGAWGAPVFDEYTDMWDLLQADPIHDVGEAGWPYAMPQKP